MKSIKLLLLLLLDFVASGVAEEGTTNEFEWPESTIGAKNHSGTLTDSSESRQLRHRHRKEATKAVVQSNIAGGTTASVGEFPFFVQGRGCAGSVIWPDIVLSAAHCYGAFASGALVGQYQLQSTNYGAEFIEVDKEVQHPFYNSKTGINDLMVVKLSHASSKPFISYNTNTKTPSGRRTLTVIGTGLLNEKGSRYATFLQKVTLKHVPIATCAKKFKPGRIDPSSMLCAAAKNKDACFGDSGGPIFTSTKQQVGVVSWGIGCARPEHPGVYAATAPAADWIRDSICERSDNPPRDCPKKRT